MKINKEESKQLSFFEEEVPGLKYYPVLLFTSIILYLLFN